MSAHSRAETLPVLASENRLAPLDGFCAAWLHEKRGRTGSARTGQTYEKLLTEFRRFLADRGADLDADPQLVALAAQAWAASPGPSGREPGPAYHNQRLAALSSFWEYAIRHDLLPGPNPIDKVPRRPVQANRTASLPDIDALKRRLKAIDRTTLEGQRDHALLAVALATGRRVEEIAGLRARDRRIVEADARDGACLLPSFRRLKGGKEATDKLTPGVTRGVIAYPNAAFGPGFQARPFDAPVWISLAYNGTCGQPLSSRSLGSIARQRLGVNFHALRGVFASIMEDEGATVSQIAAHLSHASIATTGRYLTALRRAENPYLGAVVRRLGLEG